MGAKTGSLQPSGRTVSLPPRAHRISRQALASAAQTAAESHGLPLGVAVVDTRQSQGVAEGRCWQVAWTELRSGLRVRPGAPLKPSLLWTPPVPPAPLPVCASFCVPSILLINPVKADRARPLVWSHSSGCRRSRTLFPFLLAEARAWD